MGIEIDREEFDDVERAGFSAKLERCLAALGRLLERPGFGAGPASIGAELELDLVGPDERPLPINRKVLASTLDGRVTLEVDRFNLEINARPCALAGRPFEAMAAELESALAATREAARGHGAEVVTIGILPTLREEDLGAAALTEKVRYRALSNALRRIRGAPFAVRIEGDDSLDVAADDVTFEGANTSFQVHLRVEPAAFAAAYNAAQLATAVTVAVSGNSPLFLGRRLWEETRVALFRQAVDDRSAADDDWRPARVSFGHGWVRAGALELFAEAVALHEALLPITTEEDPMAVLDAGGTPALAELRLHQGTVWTWNRAIYDQVDGGHLRVEMRALPSGPTVTDMVANAAFALGLTLGLAERERELLPRITFGQARRNFYEAARRGLDAELVWPTRSGRSPGARGAAELALELIATARDGLARGGVSSDEAERWLDIVRARVEARTTGARWQRAAFEALRRRGEADPAAAMLARYRELAATGRPVHTWPALA